MILVFAGAGASSAVDHDKYPTTVEFFKRLPSEIKNDKLFSEIEKFLRTKKSKNTSN